MSTSSVNHANKPHEYGNRFSRERLGSSGLFVIGTDTDVGKTHVACRLVSGLVRRGVRVGVYKPVPVDFAGRKRLGRKKPGRKRPSGAE